MSYKICGQGPVTVPGCDSDSCEAIVAQAKVELREEFQASQEAQSEELKQFVGDSVSESDQSIRDDFASSQETQTNELMQAIADAVDNDVDYNNVSNKPAVNGVTLQGDKTLEELGIYEVTPEQAAAAEQAQEILEESAELLDRVSSFGRKQFDQTTVTEGPTSQITFDPPGYVYSSTDTYSVYVNGLRLTDDEYSREDNVITLTEPIADAGQKVEIVVLTYPVLPVATEVMDARIGADGKTFPSLGDAIRDKANIDGYYEEMTVGDAEQLISTQFVEDTEPYLFRPTGGSADVGNREYLDKIVGGTVGWNQLIDSSNILATIKTGQTINGVTVKYDESTSRFVATGTATALASFQLTQVNVKFETNRVYMMEQPSNASSGTYFLRSSTDAFWNFKSMARGDGSTAAIRFVVQNGQTVNVKFALNIFDLTALFNPTIADYIYSLEQATAGAGVAWFRQYFPKDYYPYDPGTLRSVEGVSAHEMVGFNRWDEEWRNGYYNATTGEFVSYADQVANANPIKVLPNTTYHITPVRDMGGARIVYRDSDGNLISIEMLSSSGAGNFTTPSNCAYIDFCTMTAYGATYKNDICINLSDPTRNGEYEPYQKHTYPLDSSLTLRGVPKLVDGKLVYDGDIYPPSGGVNRRYKQVTLTGSENWSLENGVSDMGGNPTSRFYIEKNDLKKPSGTANTRDYTNHMTSTIPTLKGAYVNQFDMTGIEMGVTGYQGGGSDNYLYIIVNNTINTTITTVDALKSWLSSHPLEVVYELSTPTTETADVYEQYQRCDPSGTEEFVSNGIVPVGHETRYPANLRDKLQHLPDLPSPLMDGAYMVMVNGSQMHLERFLIPEAPTEDGTYTLKATVSGGTPTYTWEVEA